MIPDTLKINNDLPLGEAGGSSPQRGSQARPERCGRGRGVSDSQDGRTWEDQGRAAPAVYCFLSLLYSSGCQGSTDHHQHQFTRSPPSQNLPSRPSAFILMILS